MGGSEVQWERFETLKMRKLASVQFSSIQYNRETLNLYARSFNKHELTR